MRVLNTLCSHHTKGASLVVETLYFAGLRNLWHSCREVVSALKFSEVSFEEIYNHGGGMGVRHNGIPSPTDVASRIAVNRAKGAFAPLLAKQLGQHFAHVLKCMLQLSKDLARYGGKMSITGVTFAFRVFTLVCPTSLSLTPYTQCHTSCGLHLDGSMAVHVSFRRRVNPVELKVA